MRHSTLRVLSSSITVMILVAVAAIAAGWCTLQAAHARAQEGLYTHKVLQLHAIRCMEQGELQAVTAQQEQAAQAAIQAEQQAAAYEQAATVNDVQHEQELTEKSALLQHMATQEQQHATAMWHKVQDVDAQRLETLHQLEQEYQHEQELLHQLRNNKIHAGLCAWRGMEAVCDLVGGVAALQEQANQVAAQIHRDMLRLRQAERQEFLETVVAKALDNKTEQYKETAVSLQQTAQWWHERAQQDQALAQKWNATAVELEQEEALLEQRSEAYQHATNQMSQTIQQLLQSSLKAKRTSQEYSVASLILAVSTLGLLVGLVIPRLVATVQSVMAWYQSPKTDETSVWCATSSLYLHLLIFLATAAVWCQDYVGHLDQFVTEKRTVIVCYFSFVAAVTQSLLLHAIPYAIAEASDWNASDWKPLLVTMSKYFVLRVVCLMPLFAMELLFVWLSPLRTWALSPSDAYSNVTVLLLIVLYAAHLTWFDQATTTIRSDQSTSSISHASFADNYDHEEGSLLSGNAQSSSAATERTPLSETHISATSTDIFPHAYLSGIESSSSPTHLIQESDHYSRYSLHSDSPYHVNLRDELQKLILPFEMLTCFCMALIVNIGLQNLFGDLSIFTLALGLLLMTTVALAIQLRRAAATRSTTSSFSEIVVPKILSV